MIRQMRKSILAVAVTFLLYIIAVVFKSDFWSNIFAPVCDLLAAGIIFSAVFKSDNKKFKTNFILIGSAVLSWALADILWAVYVNVLHYNPEESILIIVLYMATGVFILITTILYNIYRYRKWDSVQLILDAVIFSYSIILLIWVLVFNKNNEALGFFQQNNLINAASVSEDMIELILIVVLYLSVRKGDIPLYVRILTASALFYTIIDFIYYYLFWKNLYIPNSLVDVCYIAALFGLAIGTKLYYVKCPLGYDTKNELYSNIGFKHKSLIILVAPTLILIFKGFKWLDMLTYAVLFLLHKGLSSYIQVAVSNKNLLESELNNNRELEQRISERTYDLKQRNEELRFTYNELSKKNENLKYITDHDHLTKLYNREYFLSRLDEKIAKLSPGNELVLLVWDINHLKNINNTYDYSTGDKVLAFLAESVNSFAKEMGELARLGGDEFALVLEGCFQREQLDNIAKLIVDTCSKPVQVGEYTFYITVSLGMARYPVCSADVDTLLKNATTAMHYSKNKEYGSRISFYMDIDSEMKRKTLIGNLLKKADYNNEFCLYYQPQFRMSDRKLIGMEALLRWKSPELGFVSPVEFIPVAEDENLIVSIGNWVIENAISQIAEWNYAFKDDLRVGINISPKQLNQTDVLDIFDLSMQKHQAKAEWIDIEITERIAIDNNNKAVLIKQYFKDKGVSISIDDFGTGYSSLGYLKMMSFNRIKIPKTLIDNITNDESSLKIVSSIISLASSLGIQTISEGVETEEQFNLLLDIGCDQIQGFYLGKPMPPDDFQKAFLIGESYAIGSV